MLIANTRASRTLEDMETDDFNAFVTCRFAHSARLSGDLGNSRNGVAKDRPCCHSADQIPGRHFPLAL
jgi:hypothetical protein